MTRESTNPPKRKSRFRRLFRLLAALIILFVLTTGALLGYLYQKIFHRLAMMCAPSCLTPGAMFLPPLPQTAAAVNPSN